MAASDETISMSRRFYLETVGCQMNVLDSELVATSLTNAGFEQVASHRQADVILFNTCSVRQHAEDKIYSAIGRLKDVKKYHPNKIVGVIGCMAQKDQTLIFKRAPHVDLVVGSGQLGLLTTLINRATAGECELLEVGLDRKSNSLLSVQRSFAPYNPERGPDVKRGSHQSMVRIMYGCDKFCTYCIVPSVRGPEQSRSIDEIEAEVRQLANLALDDGVCLEVTLLGQTVNSYKCKLGNRTYRLSDLLYRLEEVNGLDRLKFVSNYPRHMTTDLLEAVRDLSKVSSYLHVPAQSGSNHMLKLMKRNYTVEEYRDMLAKVREIVPNAAVTSDFIVGFCGETEEDFHETVDLVREERFKNSFIFKYSARIGTQAAEKFEDSVPYDVKQSRNNELLAIQNAITEEDNKKFVGRIVEILVSGPSKMSVKREEDGPIVQLTGRTICDRIAVFEDDRKWIGRIIPVKIWSATALTLFGKRVE